MAHLTVLAGLALATVVFAGCGEVAARPVPDVTGDRLDVAEDRLDDLGLRYTAIGGGVFGVVVRSHWVVCSQEPDPGLLDTRVELYVSRDCFGW